MSKVKISKIEVEINGEKLTLTLEETRELKATLEEVLPSREVQIIPYFVPYNPVYPDYTTCPGWKHPKYSWERTTADSPHEILTSSGIIQ